VDSKEFKNFRKRLNRTQKEIAQLLSVSKKAIHSYEQGWRNIPPHIERQMLFLLSRMDGNSKVSRPCWVIKKCHPSIKVGCPHGNLILRTYAGLLMVTFPVVKYVRTGKRK